MIVEFFRINDLGAIDKWIDAEYSPNIGEHVCIRDDEKKSVWKVVDKYCFKYKTKLICSFETYLNERKDSSSGI